MLNEIDGYTFWCNGVFRYVGENAIGVKTLCNYCENNMDKIINKIQMVMKLNHYEIYCNGKKLDNDDVYEILSDTPHNALTKCKILYGDDVLYRCYMIFENGENVRELFSYGMIREIMKRVHGVKHYYYMKWKNVSRETLI